MANLYLCGFDDLDTTTYQQEWEVTTGSSTVQTSGGRTGNNFLRTPSDGNAPRKVVSSTGKATLIASFAFRPVGLPSSEAGFFHIGDDSRPHLQLTLLSTGAVRVRRRSNTDWASGAEGTILGTTAGSLLAANTWAWISILATHHASAGVVNLYVDGVQVLNLTSQNTDNSGTDWTTISPYDRDNSNVHEFDDLIVDDDTGSTNTTIRVDSRVDYHLPNADGTTSGWTQSTGATQYGVIDEVPPNGDTDYLSTATLNAITTVNLENFKNTGTSLTGLQITAHVRKSDVGACGVSAVLRRSGTDHVAAEAAPTTSYRAYRWNYDTFPGGAAFSESEFNGIEVGLKKTT